VLEPCAHFESVHAWSAHRGRRVCLPGLVRAPARNCVRAALDGAQVTRARRLLLRVAQCGHLQLFVRIVAPALDLEILVYAFRFQRHEHATEVHSQSEDRKLLLLFLECRYVQLPLGVISPALYIFKHFPYNLDYCTRMILMRVDVSHVIFINIWDCVQFLPVPALAVSGIVPPVQQDASIGLSHAHQFDARVEYMIARLGLINQHLVPFVIVTDEVQAVQLVLWDEFD